MAFILDINCCCTVVKFECFLLGYIYLVGSISIAVIQILSLAYVALIVRMDVYVNPFSRKRDRIIAIVGAGTCLAISFYFLTGDIMELVGLQEFQKNPCAKSPCTCFLPRCPFGIPIKYSLMMYTNANMLFNIRRVYYEMQMQNPNRQLPAPAA